MPSLPLRFTPTCNPALTQAHPSRPPLQVDANGADMHPVFPKHPLLPPSPPPPLQVDVNGADMHPVFRFLRRELPVAQVGPGHRLAGCVPEHPPPMRTCTPYSAFCGGNRRSLRCVGDKAGVASLSPKHRSFGGGQASRVDQGARRRGWIRVGEAAAGKSARLETPGRRQGGEGGSGLGIPGRRQGGEVHAQDRGWHLHLSPSSFPPPRAPWCASRPPAGFLLISPTQNPSPPPHTHAGWRRRGRGAGPRPWLELLQVPGE